MPEETKPVEREAFEKWAAIAFWDDPTDPDAKPSFERKRNGHYEFVGIDAAWCAWQASADAALERAAQATRCYKCEAEVRALKGSR